MRWSQSRIILIFMLSLIFVLTGCSRELAAHQVHMHSENRLASDFRQMIHFEPGIEPLYTDITDFQTVIGWKTNGEILVHETKNGKDVIFSYHIFNDKKEELLTSDTPIITAGISPSKKYLFIHTAPTSFEAAIQIYEFDKESIIFNHTFESKEISYEWNSYNEDRLLLNAFYEDWTYDSYVLHINDNKVETIALPQPFAFWYGENDLILINWDADVPSISADLAVFTPDAGLTPVLKGQSFYYLDGWKEFFFAAAVKKEDPGFAKYTFFDQSLKEIYSFEVPHLSTYSGFLIPHYDFNPVTGDLIMIEPKSSGTADVYRDGFRLVKRNIKTGEKETIIDEKINEPINCSPDGSYCLSGNLFENLIDIQGKKIHQLAVTDS